MATYAEVVQALYRHYGRWQSVADACNTGGADYSVAYYWRIAHGRLKRPSAAARRGIERAGASVLTAVKAPQTRRPRGGLTLSRPLWLALRDAKNERGLTWDDLAAWALERLE